MVPVPNGMPTMVIMSRNDAMKYSMAWHLLPEIGRYFPSR